MFEQSLYQTYRRYRTLSTHRISSLPIVILMPHSGCNCRCLMCDIWKGNGSAKRLTEEDIIPLLHSLQKLGTKQVVMSGGEALLNPQFFRLCALLKECDMHITLLSTGITLEKHAPHIVRLVDDVIVSLDGDEALHDSIRNIPGAFAKLRAGVAAIRRLSPHYRVTARTVIHRVNFRNWIQIADAALALGLQQVSFLPADTTSQAFNRPSGWDAGRQLEVLPGEDELPMVFEAAEELIEHRGHYFEERFIAESPGKIRMIPAYYSAVHGKQPFPFKKCNAPWVSAVIEADGNVRPCFFHESVGNIREQPIEAIINGDKAYQFRKTLNMDADLTCLRCVCYLNLKPGQSIP